MLKIRRTKIVDMSPEAVAARLHDLASLYELGASLRTARVLGPAEQAQATQAQKLEQDEDIPSRTARE